jgi:hypothetical protein
MSAENFEMCCSMVSVVDLRQSRSCDSQIVGPLIEEGWEVCSDSIIE